MSDYFSKVRPAGYFNELLETDPHKLIRKYAILPKGSLVGSNNKGNEIGSLTRHSESGTATAKRSLLQRVLRKPQTTSRTAVTSTTFKEMPAGRQIGFVELKRSTDADNRNEGADSIFLTGGFDPKPGTTPVWFLPWNDNTVIQLTIPKKSTTPSRVFTQYDPDVFFTGAINGCSVFIQGTPQNPTIYHAGGSTGRSGSAAAAAYWREAIMGFADLSKGSFEAEVNKMDYITNPAHKSNGKETTETANRYEAWLRNKQSNQLQIEELRPWGCVMGIRDDKGDWAFFLQENITVKYTTLRKPALGGHRVFTRVVARPMLVRQIYPGGVSTVHPQCELMMPTRVTMA